MNDKISDKDKKAWKDFLSSNEKLPNKDNKLNTSPNVKIKHIDLHGFTLLQANEKVRELINSCQKKGFKEILLITGKGLHWNVDQNTYVSKKLSKLKFAVPEYIKSQKDLSGKIFDIKEADIKDGGEGALIIKLKKL